MPSDGAQVKFNMDAPPIWWGLETDFLLEPQQLLLNSWNSRGVYLFQINKMVSVTATVQFHEPNIEDWYATVGSRSDWFHLWSVRFLLQRKKQLNIAQRWEVSLHIWIDSQGNHKSVRNCRRPQLLGWSFTCSHGGSIIHFVVEMSNSWFLLVVRSQCFVFFGQSHLKSPFSWDFCVSDPSGSGRTGRHVRPGHRSHQAWQLKITYKLKKGRRLPINGALFIAMFHYQSV